MRDIIKVEKLRKTYSSTGEEALKGISFSVMEGEFLGLLGPNSAGKTTTISVLCGLLKITEGEVMLNGIDVRKNPRLIRKFIGYIPQDIALFPTLTVKENMKFFAKLNGLGGDSLDKAIGEGLEAVKLTPHRNKMISRCSGGIRRRTNLICGLLHRPGIIFLDEPTLGIDEQSRILIFNFLKELNNNGTTIIYTTHYMKEVEALCSDAIIIDGGLIIEQGKTSEIINKYPGCNNLSEVFIHLTGKELRD